MSEVNISAKPEKPYQKRKYEFIQMHGQPAGIRRLDLRHTADVERMWQIEHSAGWERYFDPMPTEDPQQFIHDTAESNPRRTWKEDLEWLTKMCDEREGVFYGIVKGVDPNTPQPIDGETGELQGWVYVYESETPKDELAKAGVPDNGKPVYDITYIRHPQAQKGLMASGVAQVMWDIAKMNGESDLKNESDATEPSVTICGAIEADNESSRILAESIGFEKKGKSKSERTRIVNGKETDIPYESDLFILNWRKHEAGLKVAAERVLFPNATPLPKALGGR